MRKIIGGITAPQGFLSSGVKAGIKKSGKEDIALIYSEVIASAAAVFTTNAMAAAPIIVSREHLKQGELKAIIINSGCANACTGQKGLEDASLMAEYTAKLLNTPKEKILVSSTGIIGDLLPMDKIKKGIEMAVAELSVDGYGNTMKGIMTTDTFEKTCAYEFNLGYKTCRIAGIAKGAGMIHPNMATMLSYITTDVNIDKAVLNEALFEAVNLSFNMISIDGDTSTNDTVCIMANGLSGNEYISSKDHPHYLKFLEVLKEVCLYLAQQVVRDGEGATKFIEINVKNTIDFNQAKQIAMSIAKSPLVKTAFFGQDPNWGRILCATGYSGITVDPTKVSLTIGDIKIVENGLGAITDKSKLKEVMSAKNIKVTVDINNGSAEATVWTCDFSYEYVKINGEYHT